MAKPVRIEVDAAVCVGSTMCTQIAPDFFEMSDGSSSAITDVVEDVEVVMEALENCPVMAIQAYDMETGERVFP